MRPAPWQPAAELSIEEAKREYASIVVFARIQDSTANSAGKRGCRDYIDVMRSDPDLRTLL